MTLNVGPERTQRCREIASVLELFTRRFFAPRPLASINMFASVARVSRSASRTIINAMRPLLLRPLSMLTTRSRYLLTGRAGGRRYLAAATKPTCAAALNLNTGFLHFPTAKELYAHIRSISYDPSDKEFVVRNFVGVIEDISVTECVAIMWWITTSISAPSLPLH